MFRLPRLFHRPRHRHFALLDNASRCCMLLTATEPPVGARWVEIAEPRLALIGRTLPGANTQP
ncbi:hypothetical protein MST27_11170 [Pseudomonas sp. PS1]|uniref:Uncharacterized protein n=1 Tax=Stutzerimonas marianensis TaxID=2929513 RepID=A0A9X1W6U5_9GAMM|nr:hypothetical protein [Pseudomonas marianensis]MCJ0973929.1 hypothetical protein [Pseudomonas marianensis]